jgi:hypothetical protein
MKYTMEQKILNFKLLIRKNNTIIANASKENVRLFNSLTKMMDELPVEKKLRYDKELSSENWKKTEYFKKNISNKIID